ncbi:glutamate--cysteine ligase [Pelagibaculum spongiae]|uniref:glutamate--cysteine ligase n=1 Tax=Pelagibaculum spongiae TaxID=2080658 RepID=UPI0013144ECC|nr:glutamate--cysteine ligase [Pelagibaculum spongiae]
MKFLCNAHIVSACLYIGVQPLNKAYNGRLGSLSCIDKGLFGRVNRGIERETLRVDQNGQLSQIAHPVSLGSALTHESITTDYSEALLEFITAPGNDRAAVLEQLDQIHSFVLHNLPGGELLWNSSMPCQLPADSNQIPIAQYGSSPIGQLKHIYRKGLDLRYGRRMQTIAGIHYNFSLPDDFWPQWHKLHGNGQSAIDFQSEGYFGLIRNFRRHSWLLMLLFGASPAVGKDFLQDKPSPLPLQSIGQDSLCLPWATSLRMSGLGYQNNAQAGLNICFNHLPSYCDSLNHAINTPWPEWQQKGVKVNGEYLQLNSNILQIENEYYSPIRPKRTIRSGEKSVHALKERGVEYIEVRCLDIDPWQPTGIGHQQSIFLDLFLSYCQIKDSPLIAETECSRIGRNLELIVEQGRKPGLQLETEQGSASVTSEAEQLFDQLQQLAETLQQPAAIEAVEYYRKLALETPDQLPSAKVLAEIERHGSLQQATLQLSKQAAASFAVPDRQTLQHFMQLADQSLAKQRHVEQQQTGDFDQFLADYLAQ